MTLEPLTTGTAWAPGSVGVVQILCGAVLLLLGRRLFWLLVGTVGFVLGFLLAETWIDAGGEALRWLVGLGLGLAAALVAVLVQRFAIAAAGTLVAGYSAWWYLSLSGGPLELWQWLVVGAAAVVGLLLAQTVFDFGLVLLSSLAGATLVLEGFGTEPPASRWLFLGLVVLGIAVQARWVVKGRD